MASGTTMHRLDLNNEGAMDWSTAMDDTNTDPDGDTGIVNSSPSMSEDFVYIKTTDFTAGASQVVAFNKESGAVEWFQKPGGPGGFSPLYVDLGTNAIVVTDAEDSEGNRGLAAFDVSGIEVWNHATVENPWDVGSGFAGVWADVVFHDGKIYGFSYDFSADGILVTVDPATGEATLSDSLGTDCPPVIMGDNIYGVGGAFGDADFNAYQVSNGMEIFSSDLRGGGESIFRNYMAATNDLIYVATNSATPYLLIVDPADGSIVSRSKTGAGYTGAVTLDDDGNVYVVSNDGSLNAFGNFPLPQPEQPAAFADLTEDSWTSGGAMEPFSAPIYTTTGGLGIAVDEDPGNTFGYWETEMMDALPAGKYELTVSIVPVEGEAGTRLPETRVRVLRSDNTMSKMTVVAETGSARAYDETATVSWVSDGETAWRVAIDLLSFEDDVDGGIVITAIENVKVE